MSSPVWITPAGFLGTLSERRTISIPVVATTTGTNLSYSVISGQLPTGVYLNPNTGLLLGTPVSVALDTDTTFVIRAQDSIGIADRTFSFTTTGVDEPVWVTTAGLLPVGLNGEMYAINQQYIDYKVRAETDILLSGNNLKYFIADNQGQLPPGVTLSQDGTIRGYVDDNLILEDQASENGGYDTEAYDLYPYEHNASDENNYDPNNILGQLDITDITLSDPAVVYTDGFHGFTDGRLVYIQALTNPVELKGNGYYVKVYSANSFALYADQQLTQSIDSTNFSVYSKDGQVVWGTASLGKPQVINKTYQFTVTVTDGITSAQRTFNIDVVDRNSLRVDTTFLSVDSDWFDSSAGYLLAPIWQSKYGDKLPSVSNLGSVRAGRDQILNIYDYDPYPLDGPTIFTWNTLTVNPDIKLVADSRVGQAGLPTRNLQGQNAIYFKDAEIIPVKGMQIRVGEYLPGGDSITYTITGVIKLTDSTGILNIDQPLSQLIPDSRIFYVGTPSRKPTGLSLDPLSGNIYGKLSYQPSYSDSYRFTVQVVKINQSVGEITLNDASGGQARIVGKQYLEGLTTSTTATMISGVVDNLIPDIAVQLPNPVAYDNVGEVGDIILVGISDNVEYNDLLGVMGGTTYAFIYTKLDNVPAWKYLGETVVSNQIYLLTVLGEIPSAIQWVSTSSLGSISSGQISELVVKAVNTNTNYTITYEIVSGQLPQGLTLDSDGTIKGKITNLGQTYFDFGITTASFVGSISNNILTINTVTSGSVVAHQYITSTSTNPGLVTSTFIVSGGGNSWIVTNHTTSTTFDVTSTSTSTISVGTETEIVILTTTTSITTSSIDLSTASFNATTLSPYAYADTLLSIDNNLTTIDQNWYFTVRASDAYRLSAVEREFYITVNTDSLAQYTRIYVKPFMLREKRNAYRDFITDSLIFDPVIIYRPNDPEFGVQPQIKMLIETGIEQVDLDLYAEAMQQYFYRKRFYFGEVKSILAQDKDGNDVYEIIYVDIIDDQMIDNNAVGVSVANMQNQLESIEINSDTILVDERLQPKYMTTLNADTGVPLGFIKAVPICYTIPGGAVKILSRINNAISTGAFNFNRFDFDTDRIVVETVKETQQTGWLAYPTERR